MRHTIVAAIFFQTAFLLVAPSWSLAQAPSPKKDVAGLLETVRTGSKAEAIQALGRVQCMEPKCGDLNLGEREIIRTWAFENLLDTADAGHVANWYLSEIGESKDIPKVIQLLDTALVRAQNGVYKIPKDWDVTIPLTVSRVLDTAVRILSPSPRSPDYPVQNGSKVMLHFNTTLEEAQAIRGLAAGRTPAEMLVYQTVYWRSLSNGWKNGEVYLGPAKSRVFIPPPDFKKALNSSDPILRFSSINPEMSLNQLSKLMDDPTELVRYKVCSIMGEIPNKGGSVFLGFLRHSQRYASEEVCALSALWKTGHGRAVIEYLAERIRDGEDRSTSVCNMALIGERLAIGNDFFQGVESNKSPKLSNDAIADLWLKTLDAQPQLAKGKTIKPIDLPVGLCERWCEKVRCPH